MDASNGSTKEGLKLIADLWERHADLQKALDDKQYFSSTAHHLKADINPRQLRLVQDTIHGAVHRLAFLEMVVKGLSFMEQHDAQAYAKFVEKKRKIEDLDLDELRVLLR